MKKKEEVTITFYAAECGEFHDLGEYTKCRTLEEAYKKYQKYCRTSANMCPAIEFSIHDPESIYSDMEYPLPLSSKDRGDLELVPYYNEHPLVNEAIRQLILQLSSTTDEAAFAEICGAIMKQLEIRKMKNTKEQG